MVRWFGIGVIVVIVLLVMAVEVSADELTDARKQAESLRENLEEAVVEYETVRSEVVEAVEVVDRIDAEVRLLDEDIELRDARMRVRTRRAFINGPGLMGPGFVPPSRVFDSPDHLVWADIMHRRDRAGVEGVSAVRVQRAAVLDRARIQQEHLEALTEELEAKQEVLEDELEAAEGTVEELEEQARQRAARAREEARLREVRLATQAAAAVGGYACPLSPHVTHFVDSWGWPRSGGRRHQGTDIMGPMDSPVYAFTGGVISRHSNSRLGGTSLYLRGDDGYTYFYAHLQGYATNGLVGTRVQAGDHIAFNGNSGNARGGAPHIHFERHRGGASNPYPALASACF